MTLICIDPGHAASTAGKRSPDGSLREYEFNRAVARRLAYHLERHGIKTMYSCDIDLEADASLDSRCKAANNAGADLFISIYTRSKVLGLTDRGVKAGDWYVIKYTSMPAVLVEHEFMTNLAGAEKLKAADWRDKWAVADAKGILNYLGIAWIEETVHWAEKHLESLTVKGIINTPEDHQDSLDQTMTKGQIFAMLDRVTE